MLKKGYDTLKFKRTYINGSKKDEKELMDKLYGKYDGNGDYPDCDWTGLREFNETFFNDWLHLIHSYKRRFLEIGFLFAFVTLISSVGYNPMIIFSKLVLIIATFLMSLSFLGYMGLYFFEKKIKRGYYVILTHIILRLRKKYKIDTEL